MKENALFCREIDQFVCRKISFVLIQAEKPHGDASPLSVYIAIGCRFTAMKRMDKCFVVVVVVFFGVASVVVVKIAWN